MKFTHEVIEKNIGLMIVLIMLVVSVGGLVEIVPLYFQKSTTEPVAGIKPYTPLQLAGRDIYLREGCYNCHSQMIRPFRAETERYGHYSVAGEFVYDHPFQWGSKRTGPDLARVGGRYSRRLASRASRPIRAMSFPSRTCRRIRGSPGRTLAADDIKANMRALARVGVPYTEADIAKAPDELKGRTEEDAVIAYLQNLGLALRKEQ